ncbi:MAG TPA: DUF6282 family protein [Candidatus Krumholzibacteriaceae bacterium]|nr:DUF6282 family protein [Candidatus Krumholzibacteriaceae bacterium]
MSDRFLPEGRSLERSEELLRGAIDIHVHAGPHIFSSPRRVDPFQAAIQARDAGMRGIVYMDVFEKSMASFEKLGVKPEGFRAPYWLISDRTLDLVLELGFRYDSNFMDDDMPYMLRWRGKDTGLAELPVEWLLDDWPHFETNRMTTKQVYDMWKPEFEGIHELGRYFGLTCHPQCIGRISRLKMLDKLLGEMKDKGDVWFPTCKELADWTRKKLG